MELLNDDGELIEAFDDDFDEEDEDFEDEDEELEEVD